jgi:hypothetical protein
MSDGMHRQTAGEMGFRFLRLEVTESVDHEDTLIFQASRSPVTTAAAG